MLRKINKHITKRLRGICFLFRPDIGAGVGIFRQGIKEAGLKETDLMDLKTASVYLSFNGTNSHRSETFL